ncbi:MAG: ABC transporter permease [Planctomycetota bacterium]|nr:ABC transporter permease [Planctomycetota bacterium]
MNVSETALPEPGPEPAPAVHEPHADAAPPANSIGEARTIFDYLGLPFYHRHAPSPGSRRAMIWGVFGLLLIFFFLHAVYMPSEKGSFLYAIRNSSLFGGGVGFLTIEDGCRTMFSELVVFAIVFTCILAPLFAAYSFSSERVTGTLEFLRLSPMPTVGIVLGKLFAPSVAIHALGLLLLALALPLGLIGGVPAGSVFLSMAMVLLSAVTVSAVGGLLASSTVSFRGFGAVGGLLALGFMLHMLPFACLEERSLAFGMYLSPWSAMDIEVWKEFHSSRRYVGRDPLWFGSKSLALLYPFLFHGTASGLLIWAAARRLDRPDQTALPRLGWLIGWGLVTLTAIGLLWNDTSYGPAPLGQARQMQYLASSAVLFWGAAGILALMILDHPFDHDLALTEACERLSGGAVDGSRPRRRLGHALTVAGMVLLTGGLLVYLLAGYLKAQRLAAVPWSLMFALLALAIVVSLLVVTVLEANAVRFRGLGPRLFAGWLALAILGAILIAATVDFEKSHRAFRYCMSIRLAELQLPRHGTGNPAASSNQRRQVDRQLSYARQYMDYEFYTQGLDTMEQVLEKRGAYDEEPLKFFLDYHPSSALRYPFFFVLFVAALLFWRHWVYRRVEREARRALESFA